MVTTREDRSPIRTSPKSTESGVTPIAGFSALSPNPLIGILTLPPSETIVSLVETFPSCLGEKPIWICFVAPGESLLPFHAQETMLKPRPVLSKNMDETSIGLEPTLLMEMYSKALSPTSTLSNDNIAGVTCNLGEPSLTPFPLNATDLLPAMDTMLRLSENVPSFDG